MNKVHAHIDFAMQSVLGDLLTSGKESQPRGKRIKELVGQSVTYDMRYPIVTLPSREIGYRFYPAEAHWILAGRNDIAYFKQLDMPFIWQFSDDGRFYAGAYGPRVVDQIAYVCDMLAEDPDTRQAVIEVWRPNPRPSRDIPCTISYQFLAREGKLHCVQSMRSSDAWLGYPYDAFNAAMLTSYILLILRDRLQRGRVGMSLGHHTLLAGSLHLYEPQWEKASTMHADRDYYHQDHGFDPTRVYDDPDQFLERLDTMARLKQGVDPRFGK